MHSTPPNEPPSTPQATPSPLQTSTKTDEAATILLLLTLAKPAMPSTSSTFAMPLP